MQGKKMGLRKGGMCRLLSILQVYIFVLILMLALTYACITSGNQAV